MPLDVKNGFDIFGLDDKIVLNQDSTEETATIAIGAPLSMTCGASHHNYSSIQWMFNGGPILSDDSKLNTRILRHLQN